jgi:acyl-CoA thioesterase-2
VTELWDDLLDCLDLHGSAASGFEGSNLKLPYHRLFGGQMLAQFVRAAMSAATRSKVSTLVTVPSRARSCGSVKPLALTVGRGGSERPGVAYVRVLSTWR